MAPIKGPHHDRPSPFIRTENLRFARCGMQFGMSWAWICVSHRSASLVSSMGVRGMAMRLFTLNAIEIPEQWWEKYAKGVEFYALLRRPDGTLPMYGDTTSTSEGFGPPLTARNATTGAAEPLTPSGVHTGP